MAGLESSLLRLERLVSARQDIAGSFNHRPFNLVAAACGAMTPTGDTMGSEPDPTLTWAAIDARAQAIHGASKWYSHLRGPIRLPVGALLAMGGREPEDFLDFLARGRRVFQEHQIHCRDHEEGTLALLQIYMHNPDPTAISPVAERLQTVYRAIKTENWNSVDTRFYPYVTYAVLQVEEASRILARWLELTDALGSEWLRTRSQRYMSALILAEQDVPAEDVVQRICALNETAKDAGLRMRHFSLTDLAFLYPSAAAPDALAADWTRSAARLATAPLSLDEDEATTLAANLLICNQVRAPDACFDRTAAKTVSDALRVVYRWRLDRYPGEARDD